MNSKTIIITIALFALAAGGFYFTSRGNDISGGGEEKRIEMSGFGGGQKVTIYKSPNCGCCVGYADELKKQGFDVKVVAVNNMNSIKKKYGISADRQSCHTTVVNDYFIEGHVPMEAVEKLLKENPEINGIGLPRMPSGTPGMPGPKRAPYEVYQAKDGEFSEFITI